MLTSPAESSNPLTMFTRKLVKRLFCPVVIKLSLEDEFDERFGFILKHKIDTNENYLGVKQFYYHRHS